MVNNKKENTRNTAAKQGVDAVTSTPMKIGASTPYDFAGSNLTAYGGLLPSRQCWRNCSFSNSLKSTSPSSG